jgi:hypothetical protein
MTMTHRESLCHAKIVVLVAPTLTKVLVRVPRDPVFENVTKDGEPIKDGAHETLTIGSSAYAPWPLVDGSAALALELTQTAARRVRENSLFAIIELRFCLGSIGRRVGRNKYGATKVAGHG